MGIAQHALWLHISAFTLSEKGSNDLVVVMLNIPAHCLGLEHSYVECDRRAPVYLWPLLCRKIKSLPEHVMKIWAFCIVSLALADVANSQSAIEHHIWQDARSFSPYSRTATAITGTIKLSGNSDFATKGSSMTISFGNGRSVALTGEAASYRQWDWASDEKRTAEVFALSEDPGKLENGNTLCGESKAKYAVFFERDATLNLAVFSSESPPHDINSTELCGTFSYAAGPIGGTSPPAEQPAQRDRHGAWSLNKSDNPLDDTKTVTVSLTSKSGVSRSGDPIVFVGRCKSNKTEVFVDWRDYLGDDSRDVYSAWKDVTVRIGKTLAQSQRWGISTDRKATFAPNWPGKLLKDLLDQEVLVLQTTPYGENPTTAIFEVSGLRNVLGELATTCGWRL